MKLIKDLGTLFPTEFSKARKRFGIYECPICKKEFKTQTSSVKSGNTTGCKSCALTTHGDGYKKISKVWRAMKDRCYNQKNKFYNRYGGRGILICKEWKEDYISFREWSYKNGYKEDLTIDRIDNDSGYSPENCRFVSRKTQARNTTKICANNTSGYRGVTKKNSKKRNS